MNVKMLHVLHEFHAPVPPRRAPASRIAAASLLRLLLASPSPRRVIAALWLLLHSIQLLSPCHELRLAFCTARDTLPRVARAGLWRPALIAVAAPWRLAARLPPPRLASRHATALAGSRVGGRRGGGGGRPRRSSARPVRSLPRPVRQSARSLRASPSSPSFRFNVARCDWLRRCRRPRLRPRDERSEVVDPSSSYISSSSVFVSSGRICCLALPFAGAACGSESSNPPLVDLSKASSPSASESQFGTDPSSLPEGPFDSASA